MYITITEMSSQLLLCTLFVQKCVCVCVHNGTGMYISYVHIFYKEWAYQSLPICTQQSLLNKWGNQQGVHHNSPKRATHPPVSLSPFPLPSGTPFRNYVFIPFGRTIQFPPVPYSQNQHQAYICICKSIKVLGQINRMYSP